MTEQQADDVRTPVAGPAEAVGPVGDVRAVGDAGPSGDVVELRSDVTVELVRASASDADVLFAARVSTLGEQSLGDAIASGRADGSGEHGSRDHGSQAHGSGTHRAGDHAAAEPGAAEPGAADLGPRDRGLVNYLMRDRHGSPFEHNSMTFYVQAPIFVFREFMRHRIASYNEESGRYRELRPVFYVPDVERALVQVGKPGAYEFLAGTAEQHALVDRSVREVAAHAYRAYRAMLDAGVAREVARMVLPLDLYSSMYVTMNARSLMNFLSLRRRVDGSTFPSFPQREIEMCAEKMESAWEQLMPLTHAAFVAHGRVAP